MEKKIILITGASSGIGKATAQYLASEGHVVIATGRQAKTINSIEMPNLHPMVMDIGEDASVGKTINSIVSRFGHLDVLINNAGFWLYGTQEEVSIPEAKRQFDVNVFGMACVTQQVLPYLRAQNSGTIINISSVAGGVSTPFAGWYAASKHAVEAMSDALRAEVKSFGIKVVVIQPGAIKTNFD